MLLAGEGTSGSGLAPHRPLRAAVCHPYGRPAVSYSVFRPCVWICDQIAQWRAITSHATARTNEEGGRRDPQPSPGALHSALGK